MGRAGFVGQANVALSPNNDPQVSPKSLNAEGLYIRHNQKLGYVEIHLYLTKNPKTTATCLFMMGKVNVNIKKPQRGKCLCIQASDENDSTTLRSKP